MHFFLFGFLQRFEYEWQQSFGSVLLTTVSLNNLSDFSNHFWPSIFFLQVLLSKLEAWHWRLVIGNQRVTWTALAILAMFKSLIEAIVVLDYRCTICFQVFVNFLTSSMAIHWCCLVHHIKHPWILQSSQQFDVLWPSISMCLLDSPLHKLTLHYTHLILPSAYPMTLHSQLADPDPPKTWAPLCKHQCNTFAASIMLVFLIHTNLLPSPSFEPNKLWPSTGINSGRQQEQGTTTKEDYLQFKAGSKSMKLCYMADNDI